MGTGMSRSNRGFTLVELVVVIGILAILIGIAVPVYSTYRIRANRTEGKAALLEAAQSAERFFVRNNTFEGAFDPAEWSTEHYYTMSYVADSATEFEITATATGSQAGDTDCAVMTINHKGEKAPATCW